VAAVKREEGAVRVVVVPITHSPPRDAKGGIEIPSKVGAWLGLDDERSWVILDELNDFTWPGADIRQVLGAPKGTFHYGFIPPNLFEQIKKGIIALDASRRSMTSRD
jgi:hypothetical protein